MRFENNTVYKPAGSGSPAIDCFKKGEDPKTLLLRNNIFVSDVRIAPSAAFSHTNNLYNMVGGITPGFALDPTGELSDAGFFDAQGGDLRLAEGSKAIDAGLELGYQADWRA
ncbi:MAG: DUF5123 domain-containing protein [Pseudobdellovibrionaceae bacterium]|nr:DUF5123 domain-containing protein [Pseudobdellovibrionaceae bacterium]